MKKDVDAATAEDFMQTPEVKIDFAYQLPGKQNVNNMIPGNTNTDVQYAEWIVGIYPSFKNTLAILKETGYPLTVEELDIEKIMMNYFNDENGQQEDVTYENPEEIKIKMDEYKKSRIEKQPIEFPSAGSTFKRGNDFITAKLIDECGLKGYKIGDAQVSTKHAGFVINTGSATASDVLKLVDYIKKCVFDKFGKNIELEIEVVGY